MTAGNMKKYLFFIIITPLLFACGQPTAADYVKNNMPYSYDTHENAAHMQWIINSDELMAMVDEAYSGSSSDIMPSEAFDALMNSNSSDWERVRYNTIPYYASVLKYDGSYFISPFGDGDVFVSFRNVPDAFQWLDSVYGKLCEIEANMWEAGVSSINKDISVPQPSGFYYLRSWVLYPLTYGDAQVNISQTSREIEIHMSNPSIYYSAEVAINETVYTNAYEILQEYEYMKYRLDQQLEYNVKESDFANSVY